MISTCPKSTSAPLKLTSAAVSWSFAFASRLSSLALPQRGCALDQTGGAAPASQCG
jgi:hypothetical protein